MRARIAAIFCCASALLLAGCSGVNSLFEAFSTTTTTYRYNEENVNLTTDLFIEKQYEELYRGDMEVVVNKKIDLCPYREMGYVRVSSHSTWLPETIRNSVMKNIMEGNRFFQTVRINEPVIYINTNPYPGVRIEEGDVLWYSENDPVTLAWLDRFLPQERYIVIDTRLNEQNIDAGLLREYAFEIMLLDSDDGAAIVSLLSRRSSLNKKPEAIIANAVERVNNWLARVARICESVPPPAPPENCGYEK